MVALLAVTFGLNLGGLRDRLLGTAAPARIESIAVLPLANLSGDPEQDYFAAGMHEALITDLAKLGGFKRVIARSSVMRYRDTDMPLPEIARELNVDAVITGAVLRSGDRVRITAQLIHAATDSQLWAERYERNLRDILTLQGEIATAIAREIKVKLTPQEQTRLASARQVNPEAYEAYIKGMFHLYRVTPQDLEIAMNYFQRALEKDPNYALGYAGIARVWTSRQQMGFVPPHEAGPRAKAATAKALELDSTLAEGHHRVAVVRGWTDWDWEGAEAEFRRALEINPNYAQARAVYSHLLMIMRRPEEAMAQIERALELDPHNPKYQAFYGADLELLRRYDDAIAQLRKAHGTEPHVHGYSLWVAFHQKRMYEEAVAEAKKYFAVDGPQ